jgi:hypothetical protein
LTSFVGIQIRIANPYPSDLSLRPRVRDIMFCRRPRKCFHATRSDTLLAPSDWPRCLANVGNFFQGCIRDGVLVVSVIRRRSRSRTNTTSRRRVLQRVIVVFFFWSGSNVRLKVVRNFPEYFGTVKFSGNKWTHTFPPTRKESLRFSLRVLLTVG